MPPQQPCHHILVSDDSLAVCRLLATWLKREGRVVTWLCHSGEALHALVGTRQIPIPDLLFVGLSSPGTFGLDVIRRLRDSGEMNQIPIIALAGPGRLFPPLQAHLAGANASLPRPLKRQQVMDLARTYLSHPERWVL